MLRLHRALIPAAIYFAAVFAFAFGFGVVRTLWLAPAIGALAAVACEVPLVLALSWLIAARLMQRFSITQTASALALGGFAFALLMLSELALAQVLRGQSPAAWLAAMRSPAGALGLVGQIGFALMPWWVVRRPG